MLTRAWVATSFSLLLLAVGSAGFAVGFQRETTPTSPPPADLESAKRLLKKERWGEAVESARAYLQQQAGSEGKAVDEARVVLCQARAHLADEIPPEPGESAEPLKLGEGVSRPEVLFQSPPVYPLAARRAKVRGVVTLEAVIDREGCVRGTRPLKGQPYGLTEAALKAIQAWVFRPSKVEGKPVKVCYDLTITFDVY